MIWDRDGAGKAETTRILSASYAEINLSRSKKQNSPQARYALVSSLLTHKVNQYRADRSHQAGKHYQCFSPLCAKSWKKANMLAELFLKAITKPAAQRYLEYFELIYKDKKTRHAELQTPGSTTVEYCYGY